MFPNRLFQLYCRLTRGKTLGARVVVIDAQGRVLLVKPGYTDGWTLPGGGVDPGETLRQAAIRELHEEAAIQPLEELLFHGFFSNDRLFPGDHVGCFILRKFAQGDFRPNMEIREVKFFAVENLPPDTKAGSRARIAEVLGGAAISDHWAP
ncbi:NUDIX domain-containing protein [Aestuariivirga litoralis]|uniref:NUDIX domain-containing protein n=1 Tax=Aestuariivirga litoralis TaxID=2650924 RepID=UPI0018C54C89|nr:NUDIX domain-containing protein [Aestuariivirga litoralis]MBG1230946.1 NUDIX domain-containing protein [Aestuariivirga litoralis]